MTGIAFGWIGPTAALGFVARNPASQSCPNVSFDTKLTKFCLVQLADYQGFVIDECRRYVLLQHAAVKGFIQLRDLPVLCQRCHGSNSHRANRDFKHINDQYEL